MSEMEAFNMTEEVRALIKSQSSPKNGRIVTGCLAYIKQWFRSGLTEDEFQSFVFLSADGEIKEIRFGKTEILVVSVGTPIASILIGLAEGEKKEESGDGRVMGVEVIRILLPEETELFLLSLAA